MTRLRHAAVSTFVSSTTELDGTDWNDYHVDEDGNAVQVLTEVAGLSTTSSAAAATANVTAIQAALTATGFVAIITPGTYYINETLLVPSNTSLTIVGGVTLALFAGASRSMFKSSNVRMAYTGSPATMLSMQLIYADTATAAGTGTLNWTFAGTTLTWTAPGDSPGTPVNVGAGGYFRIPSGTPGKALYVVAGVGDRSGVNATCNVYVSTLKGAVAVTGSVTSNVATIQESAHGREVGDTVEIYRPSTGAVIVAEIASVTSANAYTAPWTVTDFASEALTVHGVRNISIFGPGVFDQQGTLQSAGAVLERFPFQMRNTSKVTMSRWTLKNAIGQGFSCRNSSDHKLTNLFGMQLQNLIQYEGPTNRIGISNIHSQSTVGDDIIAFGTTSLTVGSYNYTGSATIGTMQNIDITGVFSENGSSCALKLFAFTGCVIDNLAIRGITGTGINSACIVATDTASTDGGTMGSIRISDVSWTATSGAVEVLQFSATGGAKEISIDGVKWNGLTKRGVNIDAAPVETLSITNVKSSGAMTAPFLRLNVAPVKIVNLKNVDVVAGAAGMVVTTEGNTFTVDQINIDGLRWNPTTATSYLFYCNGGAAHVTTEVNVSNFRCIGAAQTGFGVLCNAGRLARASFSNGLADSISNLFSYQAGGVAVAPIVEMSNVTFNATGRYMDLRLGGTVLLSSIFSSGLTSQPIFLGGTSQTYTIKAASWQHGLTEVFGYGTTPVFTTYGWDITTDPLGNGQANTAGQYLYSTRATAINQGPCVRTAAGWIALGTGAAGINTVAT